MPVNPGLGRASSPLQPEGAIRTDANACSEAATLSVQSLQYPSSIGRRGGVEAHSTNLQRHHLESSEHSVGGADCREVHEHEVVAEFFVAADALVVVDEVAAAIEDRPVAIDFDGFEVMRGMTVNDDRPRRIRSGDERNGVAPPGCRSPSCGPSGLKRRPRRLAFARHESSARWSPHAR